MTEQEPILPVIKRILQEEAAFRNVRQE